MADKKAGPVIGRADGDGVWCFSDPDSGRIVGPSVASGRDLLLQRPDGDMLVLRGQTANGAGGYAVPVKSKKRRKR